MQSSEDIHWEFQPSSFVVLSCCILVNVCACWLKKAKGVLQAYRLWSLLFVLTCQPRLNRHHEIWQGSFMSNNGNKEAQSLMVMRLYFRAAAASLQIGELFGSAVRQKCTWTVSPRLVKESCDSRKPCILSSEPIGFCRLSPLICETLHQCLGIHMNQLPSSRSSIRNYWWSSRSCRHSQKSHMDNGWYAWRCLLSSYRFSKYSHHWNALFRHKRLSPRNTVCLSWVPVFILDISKVFLPPLPYPLLSALWLWKRGTYLTHLFTIWRWCHCWVYALSSYLSLAWRGPSTVCEDYIDSDRLYLPHRDD